MVVRKRAKNSRLRGSHTHGWGNKKKHRGAGNRGGRGRAGIGKRGAQRKPTFHKLGIFLGRTGFKLHGQYREIKAIDLEYLQEHLGRLVAEGKAEKKGDIYFIDVEKIGYNKVLGRGSLKVKMNVKAERFSKKAEEKIKEAGGKVVKVGGAEGEEAEGEGESSGARGVSEVKE